MGWTEQIQSSNTRRGSKSEYNEFFRQISQSYRVAGRRDTIVCHYFWNWGKLVTDVELGRLEMSLDNF